MKSGAHKQQCSGVCEVLPTQECSPPRYHQCPPPPGFSKAFPSLFQLSCSTRFSRNSSPLQPQTQSCLFVCLFVYSAKQTLYSELFFPMQLILYCLRTNTSSLLGGKPSFSSPSHLINNIIARIISGLIDWLKVISAIK